MADINSRLPVTDFADGATGSAAPSEAIEIGGVYSSTLPTLATGQLGAIQLDSSGRLITSPLIGNVTGTIGALNGTVVVTAGGGVIWSITGTWVGTLTTQAQSGDGTWYNVAALSNASGLIANSTTINCDFEMNAGGWAQARLIATAWTSGTANVTVSSTAPAHLLLTYSTNPANNLVTAYTVDGSGNPINSINSQLETADILNTGSQYRAQSVTTTAALALGGSSALTNRKFLHITPTNGTIYWGYNSSVTTTTGSPLFANQTLFLSVGTNVTVYVISAGTVDSRIAELS